MCGAAGAELGRRDGGESGAPYGVVEDMTGMTGREVLEGGTWSEAMRLGWELRKGGVPSLTLGLWVSAVGPPRCGTNAWSLQGRGGLLLAVLLTVQ